MSSRSAVIVPETGGTEAEGTLTYKMREGLCLEEGPLEGKMLMDTQISGVLRNPTTISTERQRIAETDRHE